jgi:hypothetical protein
VHGLQQLPYVDVIASGRRFLGICADFQGKHKFFVAP